MGQKANIQLQKLNTKIDWQKAKVDDQTNMNTKGKTQKLIKTIK